MKQSILVLSICCLLLGGCAPEPLPEETAAAAMEEQSTEPTGLYAPDSGPERASKGALRCYPLDRTGVSGMMPLGQGLLLFSNTSTGTQLTLLEGSEAYETAGMELNFFLDPENDSLRLWDGGISFFDPQSRQTVILDHRLQEQRRIPAPEGLSCYPLLCGDGSQLYYCTASAVRVLDLNTGISRCLKEIACTEQTLTGLWMNDTILECRITDESTRQVLFLSTQTGAIAETAGEDLSLTTRDNRYYARFSDGCTTAFVFGDSEKASALHIPEPCFYLPEAHAAISLSQPDTQTVVLSYYDLASGLCTASLTLQTPDLPRDFISLPDGQVAFLNYDQAFGCDTLYCWDITRSPSADTRIYTGTHYTRQSPDTEGLAACQRHAEQIGSKYGIEIRVYQDAAAVQPWDYDLTYEHLAPVLEKELNHLDRRLSNYPQGFLSTLSSCFDGIRICIVRGITGTAESGYTGTVSGIQFMDGYTACIALAAGTNTEYSLYHEMSHLIDTVVISNSGAYDRWDTLNPRGFAYDYDYARNRSRSSEEYLQPSNRSFIDTYAMSFPKEDRARIMEYAMTPGNEDYFVSLAMQSKLKLLCEGIREAFHLKKSPETFLWEQYLNTSLAYTG